MIDDGGAALNDSDPFEDEENEPPKRALFDFVPAALIVVLAMMIVTAIFQNRPGNEATSSDRAGTPVEIQVATAQLAEGSVRISAGLPLRATLRELSADRTGAIQQSLPASVAPEGTSPRDRAPNIAHRAKAAPGPSIEQRSKILTHRKPLTRDNSPLTVVGRTAGAMATQFATDLRALPSQISDLFRTSPKPQATAAR